MRLRSAAKKALIQASYSARVPRVLDLIRGQRIRILVYHGITPDEVADPIVNRHGFNMAVGEFEEQMEYLRRTCNPVSLDDIVSGEGLSSSRLNVLVTLDDGYASTITQAFPVLERLGIPGVFAVVTSFVRQVAPLWNDIIEFAIAHPSRDWAKIRWEGEETTWPLTSPVERARLYDWLLHACTVIDQKRRGDLLEQALSALDSSNVSESIFEVENYRPLSPAQVEELARSELGEVASHTENHFLLTRLASDQVAAELTRSKREIEEWTGRTCRTLAVPGGQYDESTLEEARRVGYERVLTSDSGFVTAGHRALGRWCALRGMDTPRFADLLHGPVEASFRRFRAR